MKREIELYQLCKLIDVIINSDNQSAKSLLKQALMLAELEYSKQTKPKIGRFEWLYLNSTTSSEDYTVTL